MYVQGTADVGWDDYLSSSKILNGVKRKGSGHLEVL